MKRGMLMAGLSLKASLLLLGIFLALAAAFHPPVVAAQMTMVSCQELRTECDNQCNGLYGKKEFEKIACMFGCRLYWDFCLKHLGEVIKASVQGEIFLAEATLRVFEEAMER